MDNGLGGDFIVAYDGSFNPQKTTHKMEDLVSGRTYRFKVHAVDINGAGEESSISEILACVSPSIMEVPTLQSVDETSFTVAWVEPKSVGGCPITSYALFRDDGAGSDINISIDPGTVGSSISQLSHTATLGSSETGKSFRVVAQASNVIGSVSSSSITIVLADKPAAPSPAPTADLDLTNTR